MAIKISLGSGATLASQEIGGDHYSITKIANASAGATIGWSIDAVGYGEVSVKSITAGSSYIGLASVNIGGSLPAGVNGIGFATVAISTPTLSAVVNVPTAMTLNASSAFIGIVTVTNLDRTITGNVTLSDSKTFIGLTTTTLGASPAFIGIVTITNRDRTLIGNVTLSDSKTFIGLVTSIPAYGSNSTVYTGVISTTGNTTVFVAPASNRFFIKNLHISYLGRSEVEIRSGATTLLPFTSLSKTAGFFEHYGESGLPGRAQADAFVVGLNGGSTISYMANVRFEA